MKDKLFRWTRDVVREFGGYFIIPLILVIISLTLNIGTKTAPSKIDLGLLTKSDLERYDFHYGVNRINQEFYIWIGDSGKPSKKNLIKVSKETVGGLRAIANDPNLLPDEIPIRILGRILQK